MTEYEVLANRGDVEIEWVAASNGDVPTGAVAGGTDCEGGAIYLARFVHEGDVIPGKLVVYCSLAYVSWGGQEHSSGEYEVLCVKSVRPESE